MDPVYSYSTLLTRLHSRFQYGLVPIGQRSLLIGLCFAKPTSKLAKGDILPLIPDWHYRSGNATDFYFVGYGDHPWDDSFTPIALWGNNPWFYSPQKFDEFRREMEAYTVWKYSGACDLILLIAQWDSAKQAVDLDFSSAICCQLDEMKEKQAFESIEKYFESIFRYSEENINKPSLNSLSDQHGSREILTSLKQIALKVLPFGIGDSFDRIAPHAVANIARKTINTQGSRDDR